MVMSPDTRLDKKLHLFIYFLPEEVCLSKFFSSNLKEVNAGQCRVMELDTRLDKKELLLIRKNYSGNFYIFLFIHLFYFTCLFDLLFLFYLGKFN